MRGRLRLQLPSGVPVRAILLKMLTGQPSRHSLHRLFVCAAGCWLRYTRNNIYDDFVMCTTSRYV